MFDIGWPEIIIIAIVTILLVGPHELPRVLRSFTLGVRRLREMAFNFQSEIDRLAHEADIDKLKDDLSKFPHNKVADEIDDKLDLETEFNELREIVEEDKMPKKTKIGPDKKLG